MSVKPIATWGKRWKLPIVRHFHNRFRAHSSNWASNRVTQMESVLLRLIYDVVCTCVGQQSKVGCNTLPMLLSRYLKERLPQIVAFRETTENERFFFLLIFFYVCSQSKKTQQFTRGRGREQMLVPYKINSLLQLLGKTQLYFFKTDSFTQNHFRRNLAPNQNITALIYWLSFLLISAADADFRNVTPSVTGRLV